MSKSTSKIACSFPGCGREFNANRKADLQRHFRIHTNDKYVHHQSSNMQFVTLPRSQAVPMRVPGLRKGFQAILCTEESSELPVSYSVDFFSMTMSLTMYSSTKERPFICDTCNMSFFDKPTCNRHKREKHTPNFEFRCPYKECGKGLVYPPISDVIRG